MENLNFEPRNSRTKSIDTICLREYRKYIDTTETTKADVDRWLDLFFFGDAAKSTVSIITCGTWRISETPRVGPFRSVQHEATNYFLTGFLRAPEKIERTNEEANSILRWVIFKSCKERKIDGRVNKSHSRIFYLFSSNEHMFILLY